jgi:hypothetical protein
MNHTGYIMLFAQSSEDSETLELAASFGTEVPAPLMAAAEEVRGWFVLARGGAPFLSAADGRALVSWLEAGFSVGAILRAVEAVSERRIARRTRTPFHLADCEATLKKIARGKGSFSPLPSGASEEEDLEKQALQRLENLPSDPKERLEAACRIAREFQEAVWDRLQPQHAELIAEAAEELADLAELLGTSGLARAAEERARAKVRGRHPRWSISRICEEFEGGVD